MSLKKCKGNLQVPNKQTKTQRKLKNNVVDKEFMLGLSWDKIVGLGV